MTRYWTSVTRKVYTNPSIDVCVVYLNNDDKASDGGNCDGVVM